MGKKLSAEKIQKCISLYREGWSSEKLGKELGSKPQTITKYLREAGIEIRGPKTKLTPEQRQEIGPLYQSGWSAPKIGEHLGVTHTMILRYLEQDGIERRTAEECHRRYPIREDFFDNIDTPEKAYFLGFLYADGCNHLDANYVSLGLEVTDREILEKLAALIYLEDPTSHVKTYDRTHEDKGVEVRLNLCSRHICQQLEKLGCPQAKTFKLTYPEWMPEHLHQHFIRGYFDGDGCLHVNTKLRQGSSFRITSTNAFANGVKNIIEQKIKVNMGVYLATNKSTVYNACSCGDRQTHKIMQWLYERATIFLKRKHDLYLRLKEEIEKTNKLIEGGTQGYQKRYFNK